MSKQRMLISIVMMCLVANVGYCAIYANDIKDAFPENAQGELDVLLVGGASNFLKSHSHCTLLLNEYEISASAFNYEAALDVTLKSILFIEEARKSYSRASELSEQAGIDQNKVAMMRVFDYNGLIREEKMNEEIANMVAGFLKNADVIGFYKRNLEYLDDIHALLLSTKENLVNRVKPKLEDMWKLFQLYSEASLFGNYSTIMGNRIFLP